MTEAARSHTLLALPLLVVTLCATTVPARAAALAVVKDVTLCKRLVDLKELQARMQAGDEGGSALYLKGLDPPCIVLKSGENVEQLDEADGLLQVVTSHGTPRFIGWGDRGSFVEPP